MEEVEGSSEEEDELTDQLGILELDELHVDQLQRLLSQKTEALAICEEEDGPPHRQRRLRRHATELECAIDKMMPKPKGGKRASKEEAARKRAERAARARQAADEQEADETQVNAWDGEPDDPPMTPNTAPTTPPIDSPN